MLYVSDGYVHASSHAQAGSAAVPHAVVPVRVVPPIHRVTIGVSPRMSALPIYSVWVRALVNYANVNIIELSWKERCDYNLQLGILRGIKFE